jgi:hypothetical protein
MLRPCIEDSRWWEKNIEIILRDAVYGDDEVLELST